MATKKQAAPVVRAQELQTESAPRALDMVEVNYLGLLRSADPLLAERGADYRLYRDLQRDGKVFSGLQKRILALIKHEWAVTTVDPKAPQQDAAEVAQALKRINFDALCGDLMEALLLGMSVVEIVWEVRDGWWVPTRAVKRRPGRFVFVDRPDGPGVELRLLTQSAPLLGQELPPNKFIVHNRNVEDDNPYGIGLGLQLYWPVFFKRKGLVSWNKLNDRFASPTPHGKHRPNATAKEKRTLFDALRAMSNDGVIVTPEDTVIELLESKLTGSVSSQRELVEYMDDWISEVLLGTEPRTQGGGALAAASKERAEVRLGLTKADADLLSGTLNDTLLRWMCEFNGWAACQVYRKVQEETDLKVESETDKNVAAMGFRMSLEAVREKYGDGWEEAPAAPPAAPATVATGQPGAPAQFAEASAPVARGWQSIDRAVASITDEQLQGAMDGLVQPLLDAIDQADDFPAALAALQAAYPKMDSTRLEAMLAQALFGGAFYGQEEAD